MSRPCWDGHSGPKRILEQLTATGEKKAITRSTKNLVSTIQSSKQGQVQFPIVRSKAKLFPFPLRRFEAIRTRYCSRCFGLFSLRYATSAWYCTQRLMYAPPLKLVPLLLDDWEYNNAQSIVLLHCRYDELRCSNAPTDQTENGCSSCAACPACQNFFLVSFRGQHNRKECKILRIHL
jgi:hypothetical protein